MKYVLSLVMVFLCATVQACQQPCKSFCSKDDRSSIMGSVRSNLVRLGDSIENAEAPIFGKLGDILPFAIVGFCLQKLPEQTMMVLGGLLLYVIFNSESVRGVLHTQEKMKPVGKQKQNTMAHVERDVAPLSNNTYAMHENNCVSLEKEVIFENDAIIENVTLSPSVVGEKEIVEHDGAAPILFLEASNHQRPFSFL